MACPQILIKDKWLPAPLEAALRLNPRTHLGRAVKEILRYVPADMPGAREAVAELIDRLSSCVVVESALYGVVKRARSYWLDTNGQPLIEDYGLLGHKVVTTAGLGFIVDAFQNSVELETMKYHGLGTGSGAESAADTALGTELTTEYTGNVRATGSLTEGGGANVFRSVGSNTLDGTPGAALREHGIFSQAATGGGVLLDRTVYGAITLSSGDSLATTYDLTFTAGS
jgi:hypothetical protein